ncbi:MAG: PAS domain S-box protein [Spirochaetia bacterium]|nr:PAS domain S-box protein [Spirochaetia bacterium]
MKKLEILNENLLNIFSNIPDQIFVVLDENFNHVQVSRSLLKILNKKEKEIIGKNVNEIFTGKTLEQRLNQLNKVKKEKKSIRYESFYERRWSDVIITPVLNSRKKIINYIILSRDITSRVELDIKNQFRGEFERILLEISSQLIFSPVDKIDKEAKYALELGADFAGFSNAVVYYYQEKKEAFSKIYTWNFSITPEIITKDEFIDLQSKAANFKEVHTINANNQKEYTGKKKSLIRKDIFLVPMYLDEKLCGFILFKSKKPNISIDSDDFTLLALLAKIFAAAFERKQNKIKLEREYRVRETISKINEAIIYEKNEISLYKKICEIIINTGGYRMAWVGIAQNNKKKTVKPIAFAGHEEGYLKLVNIYWDNSERGQGPTGTAIRTGSTVVVRSYENNKNFNLWRKEAEKRGYRSNIALPINYEGKTIGSLNIYSSEEDAYDKTEIDFLREISKNLSFAVKTIRNEAIRKKTQEILDETEIRLQAAFAQASVGMLFANSEGRALKVNTRFAYFLEYTVKEMMKKGIKDVTHPDEIKNDIDLLNKMKKGEITAYSRDKKYITKKKKIVWGNTSVSLIKNKAGKPIGHLVVLVDINDKKKAEAEAAEKTAFLNSILSSASNTAFIAIDSKFLIKYANKEAERITNVSREKMLNVPVFKLQEMGGTLPADIEKTKSILGTGIDKEISFMVERPKDGKERIVDCIVSPIKNEKENKMGYLLTARDITENIKKQKEIENLTLRIINLQEEYSAVLSREVHDSLGQHVALLKLYLQSFISEIDSAVYKEDKYTEVLNLFDELAKMVSQLSRKISPVFLQKLGLKNALEEIFEKIQKKSGIMINYNIDCVEKYFIDRWNIHVYRIVQEAFTNILKHSKARKVIVSCDVDGANLLFSIKDDGIGFNLDELESKDSKRGMGLSVMKERAKLINGTLSIYSKPNEGMSIVLKIYGEKRNT